MSGATNKNARSQTPAVCAIVLALCAGGSIMIVGPMRQRLADARAELESIQDVAARAGELLAGKPIVERDSARVEAEIASISGAGAALADPTALVSRLSDLARETGVDVNRVSPRMLDAEKLLSGVLRPRAVVATTIQATGNFEAIGAFLAALERQEMLGGVQSVRLTPILGDAGSDLSATIELLHAAFTIPSQEELAAIALSMQGVEGSVP